MISLTFPDGSSRDFKPGVTGRDVAESISKSLGKKAVAMALDGKVKDLAEPIKANAKIRILTRDDPEALAPSRRQRRFANRLIHATTTQVTNGINRA